jgi:hypothetical protein
MDLHFPDTVTQTLSTLHTVTGPQSNTLVCTHLQYACSPHLEYILSILRDFLGTLLIRGTYRWLYVIHYNYCLASEASLYKLPLTYMWTRCELFLDPSKMCSNKRI